MELDKIGIDLGKTVFHVVGLSAAGEVVIRKKFSRLQLLRFTANLRVRLMGMEACGGSHFLGRSLREQGHEVRLMPAQYVKPYVKTNKNDYIDAEAIAEAVGRANMRFVPIKSDEQLDMQSLHRVRDRWVARRTSVVNQMRGLLLERGITLRKGRRHAETCLQGILEDADNHLSGLARMLLAQLQGAQAADDIAEEFTHRRWHENVECKWKDGTLLLSAENDDDPNEAFMSGVKAQAQRGRSRLAYKAPPPAGSGSCVAQSCLSAGGSCIPAEHLRSAGNRQYLAVCAWKDPDVFLPQERVFRPPRCERTARQAENPAGRDRPPSNSKPFSWPRPAWLGSDSLSPVPVAGPPPVRGTVGAPAWRLRPACAGYACCTAWRSACASPCPLNCSFCNTSRSSST